MKLIDNVEVYGIHESIKASKYPMSTDISNDNYILACIERYDNILEIENGLNAFDSELFEDYFSIKHEGNEILFSYEDYHLLLNSTITISGGYVKINNIHAHKLILSDSKKYTDHINKNKLDNRRTNLRLCNPQENNFNASISSNNTSGVIGVSWRKDRNKWRAYISPNNKQITLGLYENVEDAIIKRLEAELEYFGEFAPQKELMVQYGIIDKKVEEKKISALVALSYIKRMKSLGNSKGGSGHDNALKGIIVQFDLTMTCKMSVELERYHFIDFVSSQSTMHRITKFDLDKAYIKYVDSRVIDIMKEKVYEYNDLLDHEFKASEDLMKDKYLEILYTNPCGFQLTARMTTNYQQLKTMYFQRRNHKLPEWQEFCDWCEKLPHFKKLCLTPTNQSDIM